jgi:hypothetical protein
MDIVTTSIIVQRLFLGLANLAKTPCCQSHCDCLSGSFFFFLFPFHSLLARFLFLGQHWRGSDIWSTIANWLCYSLCFGETVPSFPLPPHMGLDPIIFSAPTGEILGL